MAPQLLTSTINPFFVPPSMNSDRDDDVSDCIFKNNSTATCPASPTGQSFWDRLMVQVLRIVSNESAIRFPSHIATQIIRFQAKCGPTLTQLKKKTPFWASVPLNGHLRHKTLYAWSNVYNRTIFRRYRVVYRSTVGEHFSLVEAILSPSTHNLCSSSLQILLIRMLAIVQPDPDNLLKVKDFVHDRYKYILSASNVVRVALVDNVDLLRPAMLIYDPYWLSKRNGLRFDSKTFLMIPQWTMNSVSLMSPGSRCSPIASNPPVPAGYTLNNRNYVLIFCF